MRNLVASAKHKAHGRFCFFFNLVTVYVVLEINPKGLEHATHNVTHSATELYPISNYLFKPNFILKYIQKIASHSDAYLSQVATQEPEAGGFIEFRNSRPAWVTQ